MAGLGALAACSQGEVEPLTDQAMAERVEEFERFAYSDLYTGCVKFYEVEACEKMRSGGVEGDLYERNYLVHLRDIYARKCARGDTEACTGLASVVTGDFDNPNVDARSDALDDYDRLWWRSCILENIDSKFSGRACSDVFGYGPFADLEDSNQAEALRADHAAGGQEGLLARVTDGAVVGTVPDIDPDAVTYTPPANDKKE